MSQSALKPARLLPVTALAAAAVAAGCGNSVPSNSVAKVGDTAITKKEFDRWLENAATGQQQGGAASVPDPPNFEKCVAGLKKAPQPQGGAKPKEADLRKQCKQQYDQLKSEVMQFLIQAQWVQQEAEERDVKVTDAQIKRSLEDEKRKSFPKEADYKRFLEGSGMSEEDILFRIKLDLLQTKLTQKVTEDKVKVSEADLKQYYEKNKKRFAQPERRDLNVVLTKTKAKAEQAKSQLAGGGSFARVAKRFSIDQASKARGGKLPDFTKGQQDKALGDAVFAAKRGQLKGPVKTQFGYYVFEVAKIKKASQQSYQQAKETIRNVLRQQRESKVLRAFVEDFRKNYKEKTNCADDFRVAECKNGPKEQTNTGPASGGAPGAPQQGAPQQGAPQQGAPQQGAPQQAPPQQAPPPSGGTPQAPPAP